MTTKKSVCNYAILIAGLCSLVLLVITAVSPYHAEAVQGTVLLQPRTEPGDPYPCDLWFAWCDPQTWPSDSVYAAPWDDADAPGFVQVLAENFVMSSGASITGIKIWGGYWWRDIAPAQDDFTVIFHNDSAGSIGTKLAEPLFATNRDDAGAIWVYMKWCPGCKGNALVFEYTFTLTEPLWLDPGNYWVEIYNDTTGHTVNNDFFWVWGHLDEVNGIDGLAWTDASAPGSDWQYDPEGNMAIEIMAEAVYEAAVDIKPGSCPNPFNLNKKGVLPVAVLGTEDLDATTIDPASIQLAGVFPVRWAYEDVSTPFVPFMGKEYADDCTEAGPDGLTDLSLKFDSREIAQAMETMFVGLEDGEVVVLGLTGSLLEEYGGIQFEGEDVVMIRKKK